MLTLYSVPKSMVDYCNTYLKGKVEFETREAEGMTYNIRFQSYANINVISGNDKEVYMRISFNGFGFTIRNTEFDKMEID